MAVLDAQLNLVRISDSFARVTAENPARAVGQSLFAYLPEQLRPSLEQAQQNQVAYRHAAYPLSGWPAPSDGTTYWDLELAPIVDGSGESDLCLLTMRDVTARIRSEQELRRAERRLAEAQRLAHIGAWEVDLDSQSVWWSDEMYRITGILPGPYKPKLAMFEALIPEEDRPRFEESGQIALRNGEWAGDYRIRRPDGEVRIVHAIARVIRDEQGRPISMTGANQDVTEQRIAAQRLADSLREKETLLREIHHRVKNNLQIIAGLLYFQSKKAQSTAEYDALAEARLRLQAMLLVHERLYHATSLSCIDMAAYIHSLVDALQRSMVASEHVQTTLSVQPLHLPIESAQPIGMILCELLTNAYRHAFPLGRAGRVRVCVTWTPGHLDLQVEDDGVGLPATFDLHTAGDFGWQLIRTLVMQLDASLTREPVTLGTRIAITMPLPEGASPDGQP
jgi:PAS domain S-box-containing protein